MRTRGGGATAWFAAPQAGIIRTLVGQVAELVGGTCPADPAGRGLPGGASPA